ncbi:hypothetical protein [Paracoccus haeundaensis]|jgi:hypothetical protein|uniref:Uncharacterized protein n=1 Tax=Paracoccus haeundaensis TaxID=225362 RepID=A0A5C4R1A8_9RHOB|nr:hypothetical protein [Paracoccus haeundaensis]TNH37732.1 hypothetical protein FHD67_18635 [Paracoccus haeundaensis]
MAFGSLTNTAAVKIAAEESVKTDHTSVDTLTLQRWEGLSGIAAREKTADDQATGLWTGLQTPVPSRWAMIDRDLRDRLLAAGVSEAQVGGILACLDHFGGAAEITSAAEYQSAIAVYLALDAHLAPDDAHSPVARYVIHLGTRLAEWDGKHTVPLDLR